MLKYLSFIFCAATALMAADANFRVQFAEGASPAELHAAKETAAYLSSVLGYEVKAEKETAADAPVIYVGNTRFAQGKGVDCGKLGPEEYILRAAGDDFIVAGGRPRGTLYGTFEFLERFAGVEWFDEFTTEIPRKDSINWPADFKLQDKPAMRFREIYVNRCTVPASRIAFKAHSRQNLTWEEVDIDDLRVTWGLGKAFGTPGPVHTLYGYTKSWDASMDDCFSMNPDGSRLKATNTSGPGQVCFSNPRVRAKIISQLKEFIESDRRENPDNPPVIYNLSFNDNKSFCHCKECMARAEKYGSYSGTVLEYWNAIADAIAVDYPEIVLQGIAYLFTEKPPKGIAPAKNLSIVIAVSPWSETPCMTMTSLESPVNSKSLDNLRTWNAQGGSGAVWNYWITFDQNVSCNTGMVSVPVIADNMKLFKKLGINYTFAEAERPDNVSFHSLRVFVGTKLMWNPDQSLEDLLKRFFDGYYGAASVPMRKLYDEIVKLQAGCQSLDVPSASAFQYLDEDFFRKSEAWLAQAADAVKDDSARLFNVQREIVNMDIARLARRQVADGKGVPKRDEAIKRLKTLWPIVVDRCFVGEKWLASAKATMEKYIKDAEAVKVAKLGLKHPVDIPGFQDCDIFDITWGDFNCIKETVHHGLKIVDDPEAIEGKAMAVETPPDASAEEFHSLAYRCGVYIDGKNVYDQYYPKATHEKYQWLKLDKAVELSPSTTLWLHHSWIIRQHLDSLYRPGKNNKAEIYFHVKRQGPVYHPGSKLPNALRIDRILVKIVK